MKKTCSILCVAAAFAVGFAIPSCSESKGPVKKVGEKIDDALDQRPAEKVRDAAEEIVK